MTTQIFLEFYTNFIIEIVRYFEFYGNWIL